MQVKQVGEAGVGCHAVIVVVAGLMQGGDAPPPPKLVLLPRGIGSAPAPPIIGRRSLLFAILQSLHQVSQGVGQVLHFLLLFELGLPLPLGLLCSPALSRLLGRRLPLLGQSGRSLRVLNR